MRTLDRVLVEPYATSKRLNREQLLVFLLFSFLSVLLDGLPMCFKENNNSGNKVYKRGYTVTEFAVKKTYLHECLCLHYHSVYDH